MFTPRQKSDFDTMPLFDSTSRVTHGARRNYPAIETPYPPNLFHFHLGTEILDCDKYDIGTSLNKVEIHKRPETNDAATYDKCFGLQAP